MSSRVDLVGGELPRDLPPGALVSHGSFLINLEGEWGRGQWDQGQGQLSLWSSVVLLDSLCVHVELHCYLSPD